ncbi:NLR family CARD domain-containing protein 3-like isoform X2 [Triplophysa dalaica]|uniref:NLR family CARD domain-containing protein 3-like isoform X2 n=1 Tax=Triplophysa dalaica TaxID=1582913 RepID=UPI0024DF8875|nr:NLR family CARD domain-containing protein 3-like isoform X2 [Triplophysa dalaica]
MERNEYVAPASPSCLSLNSDKSWDRLLDFSNEKDKIKVEPNCGLCKQVMRDPVFITCGHSFCRHCITNHWDKNEHCENIYCPKCRTRFRTQPALQPHNIMTESCPASSAHCSTTDELFDTESHMQPASQQPVVDVLQQVKTAHKNKMKDKYESFFEGIKSQKNEIMLKSIYTELYITEEEKEDLNDPHEVLQLEKAPRAKQVQDTPIICNDIFKPLSEIRQEDRRKYNNGRIRTVLTKGIAGIGKTVSVQKFILDWAEGNANQDVDFMFVLPFRALNLSIDQQYNLYGLLLKFHPELNEMDVQKFNTCKVVFIFDGLDENRISLVFSDCGKVSDMTMTSSLCLLITNLIKGELLPDSHIWITSRPAAANQIPSKYINRMTEIHGFKDSQKEDYFKKKISDPDQADRIIQHIKTSRSLHIMCGIPVFCWVSAAVLQNVLEKHDSTEIPKTLTEMYIHFLLIQTNISKQKYDEGDGRVANKVLDTNREEILKFAKLAFRQLINSNPMFYEEDLIECGIDPADALYSGVFKETLKWESVFHQKKVFCFLHLSFQEFLAALYVFYSFLVKNFDALQDFLEGKLKGGRSDKHNLFWLLKITVDKIMQSKDGHLDLFLRFLLGISLESNQRLLQDILPYTERNIESTEKTIQNIRDKITNIRTNSEHLSADRAINLFLCLLEMNDQSLYKEIEMFLKSDKCSQRLSPAHCSAIAYMLQISEQVLDEVDLKAYNTTEEGRKRLLPALRNSRKALLASCNLKYQCCESVASALQSANSHLKELDLSNNDLQDLGAKLLSDGLKSSNCQLEILRLAICSLTDESCENMVSVLQSTNSILRELDLSNNDLQDSGVELLSDGLQSSQCQLKILRLSGCMVTEKGCFYLASALNSNPSHLRELDLSYNHPGDQGVKLLSARLEDPHSKLENLNVQHGGEFRIKAALQKYACELSLDLNTINEHLSLSEENRKVMIVDEKIPYPDHSERFEAWPQVLTREPLTGRCYWEIVSSGEKWVGVAVTYKGIKRKGVTDECCFGFNDKSWSLNCFNDEYYAWHDHISSDIPAPSSRTKRIGVYLDWQAGTVSLYSISETRTLTHLHTFQSKFTEHVYAGFRVYDSVTLC